MYESKGDEQVSWTEPVPEALAAELAGLLTSVESIAHTHTTPWGAAQSFHYSRFVR